MTDLLEFNDPQLASKLITVIRNKARSLDRVRIMEVCGTHTMEIGRLGLRSLLPENVQLISGPGCPVCVTPGSYIDTAVACARDHKATLLTYGDMVRVPGNATSLEKARAEGADVQVVTSALQAVETARNSKNEVVFLAVGFETTTPPTAAAVLAAHQKNIPNVSFLVSHRVIPPALRVLAEDKELAISAFMLPGHVSAIIGEVAYKVLGDYRVPGVITGFEPLDIMLGISEALDMLQSDTPEVRNAYPRVVKKEGNPAARAMIDKVFKADDIEWRGIGVLPATGLAIRDEYAGFDAMAKFGLTLGESTMPEGCACGEVLKGKVGPGECPLFATTCTPENPVGPCMVSSEGSCAAYYKYERR